jgi:hypothetical protein
MIFGLVLKLKISYYRVQVWWRILVSFRGFFEDGMFAWWNIWVSSFALWCKWQGHNVTHHLFSFGFWGGGGNFVLFQLCSHQVPKIHHVPKMFPKLPMCSQRHPNSTSFLIPHYLAKVQFPCIYHVWTSMLGECMRLVPRWWKLYGQWIC